MSKVASFAAGLALGFVLGFAFGLPASGPLKSRLFGDPQPGEWRRIGNALATMSTTAYKAPRDVYAVLVVRCVEREIKPEVLDAPGEPIALEGGVLEFNTETVRGRFLLDRDLIRDFAEECHG